MTELSNDGDTSVVSIGIQGDASFVIGTSNLQFAYTPGAFGTPTVESSILTPPWYFTPTVTQPGARQASLNIDMAFSDPSGTIAAAPGYTEIAVIRLPILDAALATLRVTWEYNGLTTETVVFLDDESTQLFATSPLCLIGYLPGQMPYGLSEKLKSLGANLVNTRSDKTTCVDRKLITGASPLVSNELGKLAAETLLSELK